MSEPVAISPSIQDLTPRQLKVLELMSSHMTSKEIALRLAVSPHTVEKHLRAVREKWGTHTRNETMRLYRSLLEGYEKPYPQFLDSDESGNPVSLPGPDLPESSVFRLSDVFSIESDYILDDEPPVGLEELDRRFGKSWRALAILMSAVLLGMVAIWALTFAQTLSAIF